MILQYKGYNHNWCYIEADMVTWANVGICEITKDYRNQENNLKLLKDCYDKVIEYIIKETHFDNVMILGDTPLSEVDNLCVVSLDGNEKHFCYAFSLDHGVYLLNNNGKTVQRLC